jgi:hypothetical protein
MTELAPARRGAMLALYTLGFGLASAGAPLVAARLWSLGGFPLLLPVLSGVGLLGVVVGYLWLPSGEARPAQPIPSPRGRVSG